MSFAFEQATKSLCSPGLVFDPNLMKDGMAALTVMKAISFYVFVEIRITNKDTWGRGDEEA